MLAGGAPRSGHDSGDESGTGKSALSADATDLWTLANANDAHSRPCHGLGAATGGYYVEGSAQQGPIATIGNFRDIRGKRHLAAIHKNARMDFSTRLGF